MFGWVLNTPLNICTLYSHGVLRTLSKYLQRSLEKTKLSTNHKKRNKNSKQNEIKRPS